MIYAGPAGHGSAGAAVIYQVSASAQRDALDYWTPSRMAATAGDGGAITQERAATARKAAGRQADGAPKGIPTAARFSGVPTTGALFYTTGSAKGSRDSRAERADRAVGVGGVTKHFCTASVVDSATGNLVITAAHCVFTITNGYAKNIEFVPGYDNGHEPYGGWAVTTVTIASGWESSQNPDDDFAFLTVTPANPAEGPTPIQLRTGGLSLGADVPYAEKNVEAIGYNDTDSGPVACAVRSFEFRAGQREFYCHDYRDGTSGGPWILHYDKKTGTGTVIGVIGGYETGGEYEWASYSAYFGAAVQSLFEQAEAVSATAMPTPTVARTTTSIRRAPAVYSTFVPYISPSGSARSSRRTPSGPLK